MDQIKPLISRRSLLTSSVMVSLMPLSAIGALGQASFCVLSGRITLENDEPLRYAKVVLQDGAFSEIDADGRFFVRTGLPSANSINLQIQKRGSSEVINFQAMFDQKNLALALKI